MTTEECAARIAVAFDAIAAPILSIADALDDCPELARDLPPGWPFACVDRFAADCIRMTTHYRRLARSGKRAREAVI